MAKTEKITANVTLTKWASYTDYRYSYHGTNHNIWKMTGEDGTVYVWKTTSWLEIEVIPTRKSQSDVYGILEGDKITITASIKGHSEYKGEQQVELNRVKVIALIEKAPTPEEIEEAKKADQMASLKENDLLWTMPYKQYKEHYSDCETIIGSFERHGYDASTITVIIREGRLKPSGTRGKTFARYCFKNEAGEHATYYAVSEENAEKRCKKEFPTHTWTLWTIYR